MTRISDTEWAASLILKDYEKEFYGIVDSHNDENHGFTDIVDLIAIDGSEDFMHITYTTTAWMGVIESSVTGTLTRNGKNFKLNFERLSRDEIAYHNRRYHGVGASPRRLTSTPVKLSGR